MGELIELLLNPAHWGFEIISGALLATPAWIIAHRRHDAHKHPGRERMHASLALHAEALKRLRSDKSHLLQRIERLEAVVVSRKGETTWDSEGRAGL